MPMKVILLADLLSGIFQINDTFQKERSYDSVILINYKNKS